MNKWALYAGIAVLAIIIVASIIYIEYIATEANTIVGVHINTNGQTFNYKYSNVSAYAISGSNNNFTFSAYRLLSNSSNESSNLFFSPFSAFVVMSMAAEGAGGQTALQMYNGLNLSENLSENHNGFASILSSLSGKNSGYSLSIADALWIEKTYPFEQSFLNVLNDYYNATAYPADFINNSNEAGSAINSWVANKTYGAIQNLIPNGTLNPSTRAVLVNAIYFHGMWAQKFNKANTTSQNFYVNKSSTVSVPMMYQQVNASYYGNSTLQALELDYNDSNVTMLILLPTNSSRIEQVQNRLSVRSISIIKSNAIITPVRVWLPRFNITEYTDMKQMFISLGMNDAFSRNANFSKMSDISGLYLSDALQEAFIQVDENGTTAAAATAAIVQPTVVGLNLNPHPVVFRADHPFIFFIIDRRSGAILFMGRISDPATAS